MVFVLEARDTSSIRGVVWTRIARAKTRAEIEKVLKQNIESRTHTEGLRIREVTEEQIIATPKPIVVQDPEARKISGDRKRRAEREKLATQFQEKVEAGEQVSAEERKAFASSRFTVTDPETGKETIRTGRQLITESEKLQAKQKGKIRATTAKEFQRSLFERQRVAAVPAAAVESQPSISLSTGGVPLTILGAPGRLEFQGRDPGLGFTPTRPISGQETIQLGAPTIELPEGERRGGTIGPVVSPDFQLKTEEDFVVDVEGLQSQAAAQKSQKQFRAFEAGGAAALGTEFALRAAETPALIPAAAGFGVLTLISPPAAALVGAGALAFSIPELQKSIATKGLARTAAGEAPAIILFSVAGGAGGGLRRAAGIKLSKGQALTTEVPKTQRFFEVDLAKGKATSIKVTGKDVTSSQVDLVRLGQATKSKAAGVTTKVLGSEITQPALTIGATSFFGGLDIATPLFFIAGRAKTGKSARRLSKGELRKQSFDARRSQVFVSKPQQEVGVRIRSPELKATGVKERVIARRPGGETRITDIGLPPGRKGLTTVFGKTEKSLLELGTVSGKQRKGFSQAERLRTVRQSSKEIDKIISGGKGAIVLKQSLKVRDLKNSRLELIKPQPKPISKIETNIVDKKSLELFQTLRPEAPKRQFGIRETKGEKAIRLKILQQQQATELRGGFRPGQREKLIKRIQEKESKRRLQQELAGLEGVRPPGEFQLPESFKGISNVFAPKKKKRKLALFEQETFQRGVRPVEKGEAPTFDQFLSDIFTAPAGPPGPARRLRKKGLPPKDDFRFGDAAKQVDRQIPKLEFDLGTKTVPILSTKLGTGLGLLQGQGLFQTQQPAQGILQEQTLDTRLEQAQQAAQVSKVDVSQISDLDISQIQAQETAQDLLQDQITGSAPDLFVPETPPGDPGRGVPPPPPGDLFTFTPPLPPPPGFPGPIIDVPPPPPPKRPPTRFPSFDFSDTIAPAGQAFDVFAREKGRLVKVNKKPLLETQANNRGADIVDNSSAASFILKKTKKKAEAFFDDPFFFKADKFRRPAKKSKLPPKTFVEKKTFRIDSPGELKGITAKGLLAQRVKRAKESLFGGFGFDL
mgnify:CR=1 FL=1